MNSKRFISWSAVAAGLIGVALSYCAIWVLVVYWASGVTWYANAALLLSGPISGVGAIVARRTPRQTAAMLLGILGFSLWVLLWVLCFTVLGFRYHPTPQH